MLTSAALLDIHERAHRNLNGYLNHCRTLDPQALNHQISEASEATVRLQLHHAIGAEKYWIGVLEGRIDADDDAHLYPTIESLEGFREDTFSATETYLRNASVEALNTARPMRIWTGKQPVLHPGHVVLRTITHIYHHQGQVATMLRQLGSPSPGFSYPIT